MIIKSIVLKSLTFNISDLEPDEEGTIYVGLKAKIKGFAKKFEDNLYYVETEFKVYMSGESLPDDDPGIDSDSKYKGLISVYGVYLESLEKQNEFTDSEKEAILKQVEPYFSQKVNSLFSESKLNIPDFPMNFWLDKLEE